MCCLRGSSVEPQRALRVIVRIASSSSRAFSVSSGTLVVRWGLVQKASVAVRKPLVCFAFVTLNSSGTSLEHPNSLPARQYTQLTAQLTATKHWPVELQFRFAVVQCFICECRVPTTVLPLDTLFCAAVA